MKKTTLFLVLLAGCGPTFHSHASAQDLLKQFPVKGGSPRPLRPGRRGQAKVAAKSTFPIAKASDLKGAVPATNLAAAKKLVGKTATFVGTVSDVYAPKSGSIVLLNFAKNYKTAVVGAVKARDFGKFPVLTTLKGKKVALKGKVINFKGSPEVELTGAGAIRLVK